MPGQNFLHCAGAQAMPCHVDHVIGARHDVKIAVLIHHPGIAGLIKPRKGIEVGFVEPVMRIPKRGQRSGRKGQFDRDRAQLARRNRMARLIQNLNIIARHGHGRRADFHRQGLQSRRVARDGEARFSLPPVIVDRHTQHLLRPLDGGRISTFARQIQGAQTAQIIFLALQTFGVFAFDGSDGRWGGEKAFDVML